MYFIIFMKKCLTRNLLIIKYAKNLSKIFLKPSKNISKIDHPKRMSQSFLKYIKISTFLNYVQNKPIKNMLKFYPYTKFK